MFEGFQRRRIPVGDVEIDLLTGGSGPAVLLLHGYPQCKTILHRVAPLLAADFTVVAPDLRGYGDSGKPAPDAANTAYSKRVMARDMVEAMAALGHDRFMLCGHDRGARVAYRLALDHPERVAKLCTLDIVPTWEEFSAPGKATALGKFHWYFLAEPAPFPEDMIGRDPDYFLRYLLDKWSGTPGCFAPEAMAEYLRCFRDPATIAATCADYRAGATVDFDLDDADRAAGRKIGCPMLALWGGRGRREGVVDVWQHWATDVRGRALDCGHFLPEEAPEETAAELAAFFRA